jgi:hypothetical protein
MVVVMVTAFSIGVVQADNCVLPEFDSANFDNPLPNTYFPLEPKTTFVYEAETEDEFIQNMVTITKKKKEILGVTCIVVHDVEWVFIEEEDEWFLTEETYDWYALDNLGNVWYFGEETVEYLYDDEWIQIGSTTEGSWEAGVDGAEPGIVVPADPEPGDCYQQEYYEGEAEDRVKVLRLDGIVSTDFGYFDNCRVTKEWTQLEPGNVEHKYYAPEVGLVFIEELKEKTVEVELVEIN